MLEIVFNDWFVLCVPILIGAGFALPADEFKEYRAARVCFWAAAVWVWGKALMWSAFSSQAFGIRAVAVFFICGIVGIGLMESLRLTTRRERLTSQVAEMPKVASPRTETAASTENGSPSSSSTTPQKTDDSVGHYSDDEGMIAIERMLRDKGDVGGATKVLSLMSHGPVRASECGHVYNYAITHRKLDDAENVVKLCWDGEDRQKKLNEIVHVRLQQ